MRLVMEDSVSTSQGWSTLVSFVNHGLIGDSASELYLFCRAMIFSGCGFGPVAEVFSEAVIRGPTGFTLVGDREIQELPLLYLNILEHILQDVVVSESQEYQNLYHLLSSLSKLEGDLEYLDRVRNLVWERMAEFSDNPQLPGSIRVYALELMQYLTGKNTKGFSAGIQSNVIPWEGWDEVHLTNKKCETTAKQGLADHNDKSNRVLEIDCFMALKLVLLLPFKPLQLERLAAVEDKLKQGGYADTIGGDLELLMLVLFSGVMSSIISNSSYGNTFSYICNLVGNLSHKCQAAQQNQRQKGNGVCEENEMSLLPFRRLLHLNQQLRAGLVVTRFMHTNASLSLVNIAEASLRRFLEVQLHVLLDKFTLDETHSKDALHITISSLRGKLENLIRDALSLLSTSVG